MRIHHFKGVLAIAFVLCAPCAWAFLDPPYITPANPGPADVISVNIYGGECDLVDDGIFWPPPVTQQGNMLTILFTGSHEEDPEFCFFGVATRTYPVGAYAPGAYVLHVERRYTSLLGWMHETLGVIPFTVSGVPQQRPIETPTLNMVGCASLLLALTAAALLAMRLSKV